MVIPENIKNQISSKMPMRPTDFFPDLGDSGCWLRFTAALIRDFQGELIGAVETLEDITEQRLAEDALKRKGKSAS